MDTPADLRRALHEAFPGGDLRARIARHAFIATWRDIQGLPESDHAND